MKQTKHYSLVKVNREERTAIIRVSYGTLVDHYYKAFQLTDEEMEQFEYMTSNDICDYLRHSENYIRFLN